MSPPDMYAVVSKRLVVMRGGGFSVFARNSGYVTIGGISRGWGLDSDMTAGFGGA